LRDDARMVTLKNAVCDRERERERGERERERERKEFSSSFATKGAFLRRATHTYETMCPGNIFSFCVETSPCKIVALVRIFFQNNRTHLIFLTLHVRNSRVACILEKKEIFIVTIYCVIKRRLRLNIVHESLQNFQIIALVSFHNCKS